MGESVDGFVPSHGLDKAHCSTIGCNNTFIVPRMPLALLDFPIVISYLVVGLAQSFHDRKDLIGYLPMVFIMGVAMVISIIVTNLVSLRRDSMGSRIVVRVAKEVLDDGTKIVDVRSPLTIVVFLGTELLITLIISVVFVLP